VLELKKKQQIKTKKHHLIFFKTDITLEYIHTVEESRLEFNENRKSKR